jgi:exodeoxyribonuclease VII small subunit
MAGKTNDNINFEAIIAELEQIAAELEDGDISLDDSLNLFERGIKLSAKANKTLDSAQQRVDVLLKSKDGTLTDQNFIPENEE